MGRPFLKKCFIMTTQAWTVSKGKWHQGKDWLGPSTSTCLRFGWYPLTSCNLTQFKYIPDCRKRIPRVLKGLKVKYTSMVSVNERIPKRPIRSSPLLGRWSYSGQFMSVRGWTIKGTKRTWGSNVLLHWVWYFTWPMVYALCYRLLSKLCSPGFITFSHDKFSMQDNHIKFKVDLFLPLRKKIMFVHQTHYKRSFLTVRF